MEKNKLIGLIIVLAFFGAIAYFFFSTETARGEIPSTVTGELREIYEWAKTPQGWAALEKIPCYCGCKFEGHLHARHCFWRDGGDFDKHGITCSVCVDIAKKTKNGLENSKGICEIRKEIDEFYKPNAALATPTPVPAECIAG